MKQRLFPVLSPEDLFALRRIRCAGHRSNPYRLNYPCDIPNIEGFELVVELQDGSRVDEKVTVENGCHCLTKTHISDVVGWLEKK